MIWRDCFSHLSEDLQCATLTVPLDHADADSPTIRIPSIRLSARDQKNKLGTLVVNPGGPSASGINFILGFGDELYSESVRDRYDIVSFDPRGVKRSEPVSCFNSYAQYFEIVSGPEFPVDDEDIEQKLYRDIQFDSLCAQNAGPIIDHMSTADVARDMEYLRVALEVDTFSYVGFSYGTYLGITYSSMFPGKLDKLVLDSVVPPTQWSVGEGKEGKRIPLAARLRTAQGSEDTLNEFFRLCDEAGSASCLFAPGAQDRFAQLKTRLRAQYKQSNLGSSYKLPQYDEFVSTVLSYLYEPTEWSWLGYYLASIENEITEMTDTEKNSNVDDTGILRVSSATRPEPITLIEQTIEAQPAVTCADTDNPTDANAWVQANSG